MILISKQISSLHPRLCRRVWPGKAGHEVLSQFLSSFRKFEKSCVQWERRTDQCTGLTDQSPVCGDMCWPCPDHWVPPSPRSCPHWPALAPDMTCASLVSTDHSPEPSGSSWPLVTVTTGDWWPVLLCPESAPWSRLWCPPLPPAPSPLFVMQMAPLCLSSHCPSSLSHSGLECRWSVLKWNTQKRKTDWRLN